MIMDNRKSAKCYGFLLFNITDAKLRDCQMLWISSSSTTTGGVACINIFSFVARHVIDRWSLDGTEIDPPHPNPKGPAQDYIKSKLSREKEKSLGSVEWEWWGIWFLYFFNCDVFEWEWGGISRTNNRKDNLSR